MTGFGSSGRGNLRIEARSLNHRFLEINFRMPGFFYPSELRMRELVKTKFSRGKIDINISFSEPPLEIKLNKSLLSGILKDLREFLNNYLHQEVTEAADEEIRAHTGRGYQKVFPNLPIMINLRDLLIETPYIYDEAELMVCLEDALNSLKFMRRQEGEALKKEIHQRIEKVGYINDKIKTLYKEHSEEILRKWKERLVKILEELQPFLQEKDYSGGEVREFFLNAAGFMIEKSDILEEVVRIDSHIKQVMKSLDEEGPHGKRLDFLVQELFREFNTIGSKSADFEIRSLVVDAKVELERLKEQIQNVE